MIVEMTGDMGMRFTYAVVENQGMTRHGTGTHRVLSTNAIPTFKCGVGFEIAK